MFTSLNLETLVILRVYENPLVQRLCLSLVQRLEMLHNCPFVMSAGQSRNALLKMTFFLDQRDRSMECFDKTFLLANLFLIRHCAQCRVFIVERHPKTGR